MKTFIKILLVFVFFTAIVTPPVTQNESGISPAVVYAQGSAGDGGVEGGGFDANNPPTPAGSQDVGYLDCTWYDFGCGIVNFFQMLLITVGGFLVLVAGMVLDFFMEFTLQSSSYRDAGFIVEGWEILRDLTNVLFIFALLVMAFKMVLGMAGRDDKQRLVKTILVALTINFSLFFSFLLVDLGNVLGFVFYNNIGGTAQNTTIIDGEGQAINDGDLVNDLSGEESVSLAIAAKFNPQKILNEVGAEGGSNASTGVRLVLVFIIGIINAVIIFTFMSVALLMLGRTIGLYITVVLAPLAFASITVPGMESLPYVGFKKWLNDLIKMAFMPAAFLFFLFLAIKFMNINIVSESGATNDFIKQIFYVIIPMLGIVAIIMLSKRVAQKMSGEIAGTISHVVNKAVGGAAAVGLGVATGGAALAARGTVGAVAGRAMKSERFKNLAAKSGSLGRSAYNLADRAQSSTFDFRQTKAAQYLGKQTGITATNALNVKEGFKPRQERIAKEKEEKATKFNDWMSTKEDNYRDGAYGVRSYTRMTEAQAQSENATREMLAGPGNYDEAKAGDILLDENGKPSFEVKRVKEIENEILKKEEDVTKKQEDLKDVRRLIQDDKDAGRPIDNEKIGKADGLKAEIGQLKVEIKGRKDDLTDKDQKILDTNTPFAQDGRRRTEQYLDAREQQGGYGDTKKASTVGAVLGGTITSIVLPGAGAYVGAALGGAAAGYLASWIGKNPRIQELRKERKTKVGGMFANDGKDFDRDLSKARYKNEKKGN
ncbi:hypothetical protein CL684_00390 [Candidatus Campbellbacteria bacterium]|nr:hypothetical protein [Candidatus Campbellbacteria bacterium]|tara:strand:+ start:1297 stop:3606 length:2310 start_codon:yes stop_codon:yes gene_type:complete